MANVPSSNWDETKPAGTRDINLGDDDIREFKQQVREIIEVDHKMEAENSGADWGHHNIVTLLVQTAMTTVANAGRICAKTVSGIIELFYRDDQGTETQITSNGSINIGTTLSGEIRGYAGATAPAGWLICDGSAISRADYAALFAVCGILYGGGDGATTFNIPDFRGKVPIGKNIADADFDTLGETGGEKTHTLTVDEIPAHQHELHSDSYYGGSGSGAPLDCNRTGSTTSTSGCEPAGGGGAHNNVQPYQVINYIIKY